MPAIGSARLQGGHAGGTSSRGRGYRLTRTGADISGGVLGDLQSRNFSQGRVGWRLKQDGDAELDAAVLRGTLSAAVVNALRLNANQINAGTLAADRIAARSITAAKIAAGTITANEIAAGVLNALEINAGQITTGTLAAARILLDGTSLEATLDGLRMRLPTASGLQVTRNGVALRPKPGGNINIDIDGISAGREWYPLWQGSQAIGTTATTFAFQNNAVPGTGGVLVVATRTRRSGNSGEYADFREFPNIRNTDIRHETRIDRTGSTTTFDETRGRLAANGASMTLLLTRGGASVVGIWWVVAGSGGTTNPVDPSVLSATATVDDTSPDTGDSVTLTATATGGTGTISYQWQQLSGSTWSNISGATARTLSRSFSSAGTRTYRCVVTRGSETVNTASVAVVWSAAVAGLTALISGPVALTSGSQATYTVTVSGGTGAISTQWQRRNGTTGRWSNHGTVGFRTTRITESRDGTNTWQVRCIVTRGSDTATSNIITTTWSSVSSGSVTITGPTSVGASETFTVTCTTQGLTGAISYNWEFRVLPGGTWEDTNPVSITNSWTGTAGGNGTLEMRCVVTNAGQNHISNTLRVVAGTG